MCERSGPQPDESDFGGAVVASTEGGLSAAETQRIRGPVTVADVQQEVAEAKAQQAAQQS